MTIIYNIISPIDGNVLYVGKTVDLEKRKQQHLSNSHNAALRKSIRFIIKEGKEPIFNTLEICEDEVFSIVEQKWISHFRSKGFELYNRDKDNLVEVEKDPNEIVPTMIYLPYKKLQFLKEMSAKTRNPVTRIVESEIDKYISRKVKLA